MIPVSEPNLGEQETAYVLEAMRSTRISATGKFLDRFEDRFAEYVGAKCAIAVSSGTAALQLALAALDVGPGDEVIVPTLPFAATADAVRACGAIPVLADVD